jgi:hypothetical protein
MSIVSFIRASELVVAVASTYMVAVTSVQTGIYSLLKPRLISVLGPLLTLVGMDAEFVDIIILGLALVLSLSFWQRGDEVGFGRLFSLNMLMYFPAVLDFSTFNWVNLIFPYTPAPEVTSQWVFGVGLLLQATYLTLRYTIRFRMAREEFFERGAKTEDIDQVSKGQMGYLVSLVLGTAMVSALMYYAAPHVTKAINARIPQIPYLHLFVGVACTLLLAGATVLYLREGRTVENATSTI